MAGRRIIHSEETLAFVRERAGKVPDHIIGELLGFSTRKVCLLRKANNIVSGYRKRRPQHVIDTVRREYVEAGRPASDVGRELGVTATSVRRIAHEHHMERPRRMMVENAGNAVRKYLAANPRPKKARPPAKPFVPETRLLSADDTALIADFLARKPITVLPPGQAAGTTTWEMLLGTARPPSSGWRDEHARHHANVAHRRRLDAAKTAGSAA